MIIRHVVLVAVAVFFFISNAPAATLYVSLASTNPVPPYTNWSTAATTIQDAIDASSTNDLILVTNGDYQSGGAEINDTNRVAVTKAETIQSVNGPTVTLIDGSGLMRCVYLTSDALLIGFTLTNGNAANRNDNGGGALCADSSVVLSNCVVTRSYAANGGGGVYSGTLDNCLLVGNDSVAGGGACRGIVNNCVLMGNDSGDLGGGALDCTLNNSLVIGNAGDGAENCTLNNCTIVFNGAYGVLLGSCNNCIIYYNYYNYVEEGGPSYFRNCDTTPSPGSGYGNVITNEPLFVDTNDDFHLQSNSPCINSGNNAWVVGAADFDGNPRIVGGTVDIGAYEFQTPASKISYAWLQQYGLPINTNTDTADLDGTAFNIYQDWIAGLNPTNPASVLAMLPSAPTNNPAGLLVSWESVPNITYFLQSSTNLTAFSIIRSNIVGQANVTSFTDTNAVGNGPFFYRVGVQ